jgi:hypothetical protein
MGPVHIPDDAWVFKIEFPNLHSFQEFVCYGRLAVVSDVDDEGVCPECRQGVERICRAITKQVQQSDAGIEVDVMHTRNECTE